MQLAREAPANADVAVVVDDLAENGERCREAVRLEHQGESEEGGSGPKQRRTL
jgi:hypothetical protein